MRTRILSTLLCLLTLPILARAAIEYQSAGETCEGSRTYDDRVDGELPSVLIVHQWTRLIGYERIAACMLAEMDCNVFALDIYSKAIAPGVNLRSDHNPTLWKAFGTVAPLRFA